MSPGRAIAPCRGPELSGKHATLVHQEILEVPTSGRGTYEVTDRIEDLVRSAEVATGVCTLFVHHTSASLVVMENADPAVRSDIEAWLARAVPDGDPIFEHTAEGPDDMPAHVRTALTQTSVGLPVHGGRLDLGTWQGIFLYEHRLRAQVRRLSVTVIGSS